MRDFNQVRENRKNKLGPSHNSGLLSWVFASGGSTTPFRVQGEQSNLAASSSCNLQAADGYKVFVWTPWLKIGAYSAARPLCGPLHY